MSTTITDDAVGKDVIDGQGDKIGIVTAVDHGTAKVDTEPGITDKLKAKLSWEDEDREDYPLQERAIASVTDDEIRLAYPE